MKPRKQQTVGTVKRVVVPLELWQRILRALAFGARFAAAPDGWPVALNMRVQARQRERLEQLDMTARGFPSGCAELLAECRRVRS